MGEGGDDVGGNSNEGNDHNYNYNYAWEQTLSQTEHTTGANVCCWPQQQCSSRNNGLTQQSKMGDLSKQRTYRNRFLFQCTKNAYFIVTPQRTNCILF